MGLLDRLLGLKNTGKEVHAPGQLTDNPERATEAMELPRCPANPDGLVEGKIAFTNGDRKWTEAFHAVSIAVEVLEKRGQAVTEHPTWLELPASGFLLQPRVVDIELLEDGGLHTVTTIDVRHRELVATGLFEYQHSTGDGVRESLSKGFASWTSVDLPVLLDALRPKPEHCTLWEMEFPPKDRMPSRTRRAVLGNTEWLTQGAQPSEVRGSTPQGEGEHPFCNCCFLTRNYEVFRPYIESDECFGIRFYAMRDNDGTPGADCRINGEDYGPGIDALRSYVSTWPGEGFESRKQYVVLHTAT